MPSSMTHLLCASRFMPSMPPLFCIGCIAPDCIDIREIKDKGHLRLLDRRERLAVLEEKIKSSDKSNLFLLGTVFHLFADYKWDIGPQEHHRQNYKGNSWFLDYRREIRLAGLEIYSRFSWSREIFDRLLSVPQEDYSLIADYPSDKIRYFIINSMKKTIEGAAETDKSYFTPELIDSFADETAKDFLNLLSK